MRNDISKKSAIFGVIIYLGKEMDFSGYYERISRLDEEHLSMVAYLAFYGGDLNLYGPECKDLCDVTEMNEASLYKAAQDLEMKGFAFTTFYSVRISILMGLPVLSYIFNNRIDIGITLQEKFGRNSKAYRFFELVGSIFGAGAPPKGKIDCPDYARSYILMYSVNDPQIFRLSTYLDDDEAYYEMITCVNNHHVIGRILPHGVFDMWREGKPSLKANISALEGYHSYVQDGVCKSDAFDGVGSTHLFRMVLAGIRSCNFGRYEEGLELFRMSKNFLGDLGGVPKLFFVTYYAAAACLHLPPDKRQALAKKFVNPKLADVTAYQISTLLGTIALSPRMQANRQEVRDALAATFDDTQARNVVYLAQMIGQHFEVPDLPFVTGESDYAIVRHEVTPMSQMPNELTAVYGNLPAVLSVPYKHAWEHLLDDLCEQLTASEQASAQTVRQTRCVYVLDERSKEVIPMEQRWLKSQRWGKPKELSHIEYTIDNIENPDKYDEAFALACKSVYNWPKLSVLASLRGCDRLYVRSRPSADVSELKITDEAPYVSVEKKGSRFVVESNLELDDLRSSPVVKKKKTGEYVCIELSAKAKSVLKLLLGEGCNFPLEAEPRLCAMLSLLDEVVEVRSKLLDRKLLPVYKGRPMIVAKMQPVAIDTYEAVFCGQPLPDSTKTPPPGEGRKEIVDIIAGAQVRIDRDLDGERAAYERMCDALDNVNGVDLYDDEFRASLSIEAVLDLISWARAHPDTLVIDWMQGRGVQVKQAAGSSWNVSLTSNNGWFDIEGEVRIDDETVISMARLLEVLQNSKGRYLRLDDGLFINIDKKLRRQLERIEALTVSNRNKLQISQINAAMLDDDALNGEFKIAFDQKLARLMQNVKDSSAYNPQVPPALKAELRPYQLEGYRWMSRLASWGAGACLADDMGLGKTVQTIAFLLQKSAEGPALVVSPSSVVPNWAAEIERFAPSLRVSILNKADDRTQTIAGAKVGDVVLSTYGLLNTEEQALVEKKWTTICLDEAHTIKNRETKMSAVAMRLSADYRIILTGTPIQNHLGEIWNLFRFINPGLLGGYDAFRHKFLKPITEDNDKGRRKALQSILRPFMLRRTKDEVIDDLPEKNEITVPVELSDAELTRYEAMRKKAAKEFESIDKVDINTLAEITRLRRAACSMALVDSSWKGRDSKLQAFLDIVSEFKGNGSNRMLVFSQFTSYLDIVRKALEAAGEKYLYLDGSTTMKQREQLVAQFRNGDTPLFLISLKAGGLGLNLPEANYVMHLDPWWNPAIEQQATDRAYRIGQKRDVTVYHLVAKNTIEEKILRLHRTKRDLADSLLEGANIAGRLTVKDILELLSNS